uniref:DUF4283 domain-containing protein n=2 Tax=Brassica oleracea TaxID=3712 RepID=A0A0D3BBH7_BRAOL|nr:unnamed protein product [Brassica oleracea]
MAKKQKPKNTSKGGNPTGSTDSSTSSRSVASKAADLVANSPSASKTNDLPGDSASPANTVTVVLQNHSGSDFPQTPEDLVNPNSKIVATNSIVPAQEGLIQRVDESTLPPPLSTGKLPEDTGNQEHDRVAEASKFWKGYIKPHARKLEPEGKPFTLDSGEACVTIPNSVIEKNRKAWDSFIVGQFYEEPPARGAVHAIVNGIWSKQRRDISVSKMESHAFLFRVPCPHARRRILSQCLWQIDGQTMFVAKWSPGMNQEKPELSAIPVWLDFWDVPLQFFNEDALKEIAGLVGKPICLHPATKNLTNLDVAKVYTIIDPCKPLSEAVNASFESGEVQRIKVTSPWLPAVCGHCLQVGHTISRCSLAPKTCNTCRSAKHNTEDCPRSNNGPPRASGPKSKPKVQAPLIADPPAPFEIEPPNQIVIDAAAFVVADPPASPAIGNKDNKDDYAPLNQRHQKKVLIAMKSNQFTASSSGPKSPLIPHRSGSSHGVPQGVLDSQTMGFPQALNYRRKKMITQMMKGTGTIRWSPRGFKNS